MLSPVALSLFITLAQAGAPTAPNATGSEAMDPAAEGQPDRYAGLSLGPQARNPLPVPKEAPPRLMWTGFSGASPGGEIFLQTTRSVVHDMAIISAPGGRPTLAVLLRNCRIHWKNNARRIDTSFFATPVDGLVARQKRRDVEISVALRESVMPAVRTAPGPDGTQLLVLSFAADSASSTASKTDDKSHRAAALVPPSLPVAASKPVGPAAVTPPPLDKR